MSAATPSIFGLEPFLLETPWGAGVLQRRFGKNMAAERPLGEAWEVSCVEGRESRIFDGRRLIDAFLAEPARFGVADGAPFPILTKLLATADILSVQVHPDDATAKRLDGAASGKHEAWVVLDVAADAELYVGLAPGATKEALCAASAAGDVARVKACLLRRDPRPGDVYDIAPGTVHAPGRGLVLYEVQQPSDLTYRLFDWGRKGLDGLPRLLHVDRALEAIDPSRDAAPGPASADGADVEIVRSPYFSLRRHRVEGRLDLGFAAAARFLTCVGGAGRVKADGAPSVELTPGASCAVLPEAKNVRLVGAGLLVLSAAADG